MELTDDYLAMIDYFERLLENQPGSHKTDHWQGTRRYLDSFKHATLTPRRLTTDRELVRRMGLPPA
jgi:hypothetical protein